MDTSVGKGWGVEWYMLMGKWARREERQGGGRGIGGRDESRKPME